MKIFKSRKHCDTYLLMDFGDHFINCVVGKISESQCKLYPPKKFEINESYSMTAKKIKKTYADINTCLIAIPHTQTFFKLLPFHANMNERNILQILKVELQHQLYSNEQLDLDIEMIERQSDNMMLYRILVARSSLINFHVQSLKNAGLHLKIIDVESLVLERLVSDYHPDSNLLAVFFAKDNQQIQMVIENRKILSLNNALLKKSLEQHCQVAERFLSIVYERHFKEIPHLLFLGDRATEISMRYKQKNEAIISNEKDLVSFLSSKNNMTFIDPDCYSLMSYGLMMRMI